MTTTDLRAKLASLIPSWLRSGQKEARPWDFIPVLTHDEIYPVFRVAFDAYDDWFYAIPEIDRAYLPSHTVANDFLDRAAKASYVEALRVYTKFPELCHPNLARLIRLLREVNHTTSVNRIITADHVTAYRRIVKLRTGLDLNYTATDELAKFVLGNMDESDAVLMIAEQREIVAINDIRELLAASAVAPALGEGAL